MVGLPGGAPLKILHLAHIQWFNAEVQYALDLALEMEKLGHTACFFSKRASLGVERARAVGLPVVEEEGFNAKRLGSWRALPAAWTLHRLLRAERFDIVEAHRSEGLPLIALACRAAGVPVVRVRGDMRPVRRDPLNRLVYTRGLAGIVAANRSVERDLRRRLGPRVRVTTIFGGVDPERFTPAGPRADLRAELGLEPDAFLVGLLGRIGAVKGHADFLAAARTAARAQPRMAFVLLVKGSRDLPPDIAAFIEGDEALRRRVRVLGHREDLPGVLRSFDLGVIASVGSEANCRVGLEWMASGVPLVATRVGVLPDIVVEGRTGLLVPPGAPQSLSEALAALGANRTLTASLGDVARLRVLERFTLARCGAEHVAFLETVLRERGAERTVGRRANGR